MTWVRLDEEFARHPKVLEAGPLGMAMHVAALCYCNQYLTDGYIPHAVPSGLLNLNGIDVALGGNEFVQAGCEASWDMVVDNLVRAGLWVPVDTGGWVIHDYHEFQPSKAEVLELRKQRAEAGKKGGEASAKARAKAGAVTNAQARATANGQAKSKPDSVPVPDAVPFPVLPSIDEELKGNALDVGPFIDELKDIDEGTERVIRGIGKELPEAAFHTALESLRDRRQRKPELDSETRYFIGTLASMKREGQYA